MGFTIRALCNNLSNKRHIGMKAPKELPILRRFWKCSQTCSLDVCFNSYKADIKRALLLVFQKEFHHEYPLAENYQGIVSTSPWINNLFYSLMLHLWAIYTHAALGWLDPSPLQWSEGPTFCDRKEYIDNAWDYDKFIAKLANLFPVLISATKEH